MIRGFSTLELLIALAVISLSLSATLFLLPVAQTTTFDTQTAQEALDVAKHSLEEMGAASRKDFKLAVSTTSTETHGPIVFTKVINASTTDLLTRMLTAKVSWGGLFGRQHSITLATMVTNFEDAQSFDTCDSVIYEGESWTSPTKQSVFIGTDILADSASTYPVSDIDVFKSTAFVTVSGSEVIVPQRNPTSAVNSTQVGTVVWSSPTNVLSNNGSHAQATIGGGVQSNYIVAKNFGFSIPRGATILGIRAYVDRSRSSGGSGTVSISDAEVRIVKADGTLGSQNKYSSASWGTSDATVEYGNTKDLWGEEWKSEDINDADFGLAFSAKGVGTGSSKTARVDHIAIQVTYIQQFYPFTIALPANFSATQSLSTAPSTMPVGTGFNSVTVASSSVYGSFAFVSTASTTRHIQVIDLGGANPRIVYSYGIDDAFGTPANVALYKNGNLYVGLANNSSGPEFFVLDVHNPLSIPDPIAEYEVGAGVQDIKIQGNRAYLATSNSSKELVVLSLIDPFNPVEITSVNTPGVSPADGKSVYVVGDTVHLGQYYAGSSAHEYSIWNASTSPASLIASANIDSGSATHGVYGVVQRSNFSFLLTGNSTSNSARLRVFAQNGTTLTERSSSYIPDMLNPDIPVALDCEGTRMYTLTMPRSGANAQKGRISVFSN